MAIQTLDAKMIQKLFLAGASSIEAKKEYINELNVFPVPDGDTGTNMTLTIMSAAKEVNELKDPSMEVVCKAISGGSLRGARGNSGVILSQLLRGFTKGIREAETVDVKMLAAAFSRGVDTAYKAVMKPKEGTILTVARGGAEIAATLAEETDDVLEFADRVIEEMEKVLENTPELLPVLKEAGVVDSGGEGLVTIMKGANDALHGKEIHFSPSTGSNGAGTGRTREAISTDDIKFGYCTEFIINTEKEFTSSMERDFKGFLESIGDSIVCVADEGLVKIHVHTNDPGAALTRAITYGSLSRLKIDNMREEHNERFGGEMAEAIQKAEKQEKKPEPPKEQPKKAVGFISVAAGEGLNEIFRGLGCDYLIPGGQTMNPSTEDMLLAIDQVNAETIFILPNNKNIILAAEQAAKLSKEKKILVIPSKTIPQGINALINFIFEKTPEENLQTMTEEMKNVKTGQVTYAVRDTSLDGKTIHQGDIMGLGDSAILSVGNSVLSTTLDLISNLVEKDSELISLYYGEDISEQDASALEEELRKTYPDLDIEAHSGGQPIYYYILSVE